MSLSIVFDRLSNTTIGVPSRSTGFTALPSTFAYLALISFSCSVLASLGYRGTMKPCALNSAIAAFSCGIEALMLGSFMILASGVFTSLPSSASSSTLL